MIDDIQEAHRLSISRSCALMSISKAGYYRKPKKCVADAEISSYLKQVSVEHKRWGFDKMMAKAKLMDKPWNHKRVHRIYCELGLNLRIKPRKRLPRGEAKCLVQPLFHNICWSIDFMSDALSSGVKFRTLNVIDDYNREALMVEPSYSLHASRVTDLLDLTARHRGYPSSIRVDHGPEFESHHFKNWCKQRGISPNYIQPGKPAQNAFIERFNRTYREEVLDSNLFYNLAEVKEITQCWLKIYNQERPHQSLAGLPPTQFAKQRELNLMGKGENSTSS